MSRFFHSCTTWSQRHLARLSSPRAWGERFAGAVWLAGVGVAFGYAGQLPRATQVVVAGLLLLAFVALLRRGWIRLFGPVLMYDLVRLARRGRFVVLRCAYASMLLLLLCAVYLNHSEVHRGPTLGIRQMAGFAESFFLLFMTTQTVAVVLLTPAFTAGAIAEEKDRKTLEFMLATDLSNREIVLSKLVAHLAQLLLLVLTGLPVLGFLQLLGGVDPDLVLTGFAATGLTLVSLASLSVLLSVYARKPREAIVLTYLVVAAYVGLSLSSRALLTYPWLARLAVIPGATPVRVQDVVDWLNAGNFLVALSTLHEAWSVQQPVADALLALLGGYALFHGLVTLGCISWAIARLRAVALEELPTRSDRLSPSRRSRAWPSVGRAPMLWKEVFAEPGLSFTWMGRAIVTIIVLVSILPAVWIGTEYFITQPLLGGRGPITLGSFSWNRLDEAINRWVRSVGTLVACLMLLGVAVRAASSVSGERDRQTLDGLLTSRLTVGSILYAKWLGSIVSVRRAWLWLCLIWGLGLLAGGLDSSTLPWLVLAWFVYAGFVAMLGLWFSTVCRTTLRATLGTLAATAALGVGHWLLSLIGLFLLLLPWRAGPRFGEEMRLLLTVQLYGFTPPVSLSWLAFHGQDLRLNFVSKGMEDPWTALMAIILGFVCWTAAGGLLWRKTCTRFRRMANRRPRHE